MAARSKAARRKAGNARAGKAGRKKAARQPARKTAARRAAPRAAKTAARPAANPAEALARKIVRVSSDPTFPFQELYTADCLSTEATGESFRGHAGLAEKMRNWDAMQESSTFKARNVFVKGNLICIEWEGTVKLRDGRTVTMNEVAVHEVRGGKIAVERYYYNPLALAPPGPAATPA